jgi:hypothetical protein
MRRIKFFQPVSRGTCENCFKENVLLNENGLCKECSFRICDVCGEVYWWMDGSRRVFWEDEEYGIVCDKCRREIMEWR